MTPYSHHPTAMTDWRLAKRLTLQEIGDALGVSRELIRQYEQGIALPSGSKMTRLAGLLGVTEEQIRLHYGERLRARSA